MSYILRAEHSSLGRHHPVSSLTPDFLKQARVLAARRFVGDELADQIGGVADARRVGRSQLVEQLPVLGRTNGMSRIDSCAKTRAR